MIDVLVRTPESVLLRPSQDLRMENAHEFLEEFRALPGITGTAVFLDFSRMQFVDSSGIGTLIKISELMKHDTGTLSLVGLNRALLSVFRLSGLMQVFRVMETADLSTFFSEEQLRPFY